MFSIVHNKNIFLTTRFETKIQKIMHQNKIFILSREAVSSHKRQATMCAKSTQGLQLCKDETHSLETVPIKICYRCLPTLNLNLISIAQKFVNICHRPISCTIKSRTLGELSSNFDSNRGYCYNDLG